MRDSRSLRRRLVAVLLFGTAGLLVELFLIGHNEDWRQLIPVIAMVAVLVATFVQMRFPGQPARRLFVAVMWGCVAGGLLGVWWHYQGNVEFELEMYPNRAGLELFRETMTGATPVLAAGAMTLIGLLGLVAATAGPQDG